MIIRILVLLLSIFCSTYTMEQPSGKRPAQEPIEKIQGEPKTQKGETELIVEQPTHATTSLTGIPRDIKEIILGFLGTAQGATQQIRLINAAQNIRNLLMSSKKYKPLLDDEQLAGQIITELAKRYANNNIVIAAQALATKAANGWLTNKLCNGPGPDAEPSECSKFFKLKTDYTLALTNAINNGDVGSVRFLLENKLIPQMVNNIRIDYYGRPQSLLLAAVITGNKDMVALLLKLGANPNYTYLVTMGNQEYQDGVMRAGVQQNLEIVKALVAAGGDLNQLDPYGDNLLGFARNAAIASYLIEKGLDVNQHNHSNGAPLDIAMEENHADVIKVLLDAGANPDVDHLFWP